MKKLILTICLLSSYCVANTVESNPEDFIDEVEIMLNFYNNNYIEYEGHLWFPVMLEHHPKCPCQPWND